jgi:hypothetical protein
MSVAEHEATEQVDRTPAFYTVAIYLIDKAYGGSEEGGWWFTCGDRQDEDFSEALGPDLGLPKVFPSEDAAEEYAEAVQRKIAVTLNEGRRPISSVLSEGIYEARVYPGFPPRYFPETRPHYE